MKLLFVILFFQFIFYQVFGQLAATHGNPFIEFFNEQHYSTELQCWAIVQDHRGVFYFANNNGILEYDGRYWRLISVSNNSSVRSLSVGKDGTVYVGANREFGMLKPDSSGKMVYKSLSKLLPETKFETVWRIHSTSNGIYFVAGRQIIFKYADNILTQLASRAVITEMRTFKIGDDIYLSDINEGMGKIINDTISFLNCGYDVSKKVIYAVLPYSDDELLLCTRREGLFILNLSSFRNSHSITKSKSTINESVYKYFTPTSEKNVYLFNTTLNDYFKQSQIYSGIRLSDNSFALATLLGGVIVFDKNGTFINVYNRKNGINDNSVYALYEDSDNNLWIGMESGIARLELASPFSIYDKRNGLDGTILSSYFYKNNLYVGTSNGIFTLDNSRKDFTDTINSFKMITNRLFNLDFLSVSNYEKSKSVLLASSLREILHIDGEKITELKKVYGCYSLTPSLRIPGRVFLGHSNGISALRVNFNKNENVTFTDEGELINLRENIRNIIIDIHGDLWFSTAYNGIGFVRFNENEDLSDCEVFKFDTTKGLPQMSNTYLAYHNGKVLLATSKGLYKVLIPDNSYHNPYSYRLVPETNYGLDFSKDSISVSLISVDNKQNLWMYTSAGLAKFDLMSNRLITTPFKRIRDEKIDKIYVDNQGNAWFVSKSKLFRYDIRHEQNFKTDFPVLIRKVTIGKDSVIFSGTSQKHDTAYPEYPFLTIDYKYNSIAFEYAALFFNKENQLHYSYFLEGFDKEWSNWSKEAKAVYTNLPSGKYNFYVKAKNIFDNESNTAILHFYITTPWYLSIYAYFLYLILIVVLIYLIIYVYTLRLKAEKDKLEELIKAAINKVEQQKEELKTQAERLAQSNTELEKLSIVARETDNAVVIMDPRGNYEWINEGFTRMYGYSLEQLIEDKSRTFIGATSNLNIKDLVNIWFGDKKPIIYESQSTTKDGRKIWAQTTLTPIVDETGKLVRLIAIDSDITKLKNAEAEIQLQRDEIQRQRDLALKQRDEISMQKKEITDSIHYAKRIQKAILPTEEILRQYLPESFLFYLPRDIVSGDFFWVTEKGSKIFIAVADCTGHGVPGALMSMIGVAFLNEIVVEKGISNAADILNHLRFQIIASLRQSSSDVENQDGMDISLCVIDKETNIIDFAGANQPLLYSHDNEMHEVKPDKMPISIGLFEDQSFNMKSITPGKGNMVYMFSDGYIDQFGGPGEKKFKFSSFKNLLKDIYLLPVEQQKIVLEIEFEKWKGDLSQVDDIIVVGFRI